jgi:DNA-binding MarR family transcriptional regulator
MNKATTINDLMTRSSFRTFSHFVVLEAIHEGKQRLRDIAGALKSTNASALQIVDSLVTHGYLVRLADDLDDRRCRSTYLTPKGLETLYELYDLLTPPNPIRYGTTLPEGSSDSPD